MKTKVCSKCGKRKLVKYFYKTKSHGRSNFRGDCKKCFEKYRKKYFQENPNKRREYHKKWRDKNKEYVINKAKKYKKRNPIKIKFLNQRYWLKKAFNLTIEDYNNLLKNQGNKCAICKTKFKKLTEQNIDRLCIDHNHKTEQIRGLLCTQCNLAIGNLKEKIQYFKNAIKYLQETK